MPGTARLRLAAALVLAPAALAAGAPSAPLTVARARAALLRDPLVHGLCRTLLALGPADPRAGLHAGATLVRGGGPARRGSWRLPALGADGLPALALEVADRTGAVRCRYLAVLTAAGGLRVAGAEGAGAAVHAGRRSSRGALPTLLVSGGGLVERVPLWAPGEDPRHPGVVLDRPLGTAASVLAAHAERRRARRPWPLRVAAGPAAGAHRPLRVLVVGDSTSTGPRAALAGIAPPWLSVSGDNVGSTGLVRPDFFNWPARLAGDLAGRSPDVVAVVMGANDVQPMRVGSVSLAAGTAPWLAQYARRAGRLENLALARGAEVVWLGLPRMPGGHYGGVVHAEERAVARASRGRIGATFVNGEPLLPLGVGRGPDGIHPDATGAEVMARALLRALAPLAGHPAD